MSSFVTSTSHTPASGCSGTASAIRSKSGQGSDDEREEFYEAEWCACDGRGCHICDQHENQDFGNYHEGHSHHAHDIPDIPSRRPRSLTPQRMARGFSDISNSTEASSSDDADDGEEWHEASDILEEDTGSVRGSPDSEAEQESHSDDDMYRNANKRTSWGGSLINGVVGTAVFGAAVGLTAYRIWKGWGVQQEEDEAEADEYFRRRPEVEDEDGNGYPPRSYTPKKAESLASYRSYRSSPASARRRQYRNRAQRPTIAELVVASARARDSASQPPLSPVTSVTSASGLTAPPVSVRGKPVKSRMSDVFDSTDAAIAEDSDEEEDAMNARLDEMTRRLQALITEGQTALASPSSTPAKTSNGPLHISTTPLTQPDWSASSSTSAASTPSTRRHASRIPTASPFSSRDFSRDFPRDFSHFRNRSSISALPVPVRQRVQSISNSPTAQSTAISIPGATPTSPRAAPRSVSSPVMSPPSDYAMSSSLGSSPERRVSASSPGRGLPPLPWRRDPSGGSKWVQRPLSPAVPERSVTPVPPVPPVPPELAHAVAPPVSPSVTSSRRSSRPSSLYSTSGKSNGWKRMSTPPIRLTSTLPSSKSPDSNGSPSPMSPISPTKQSKIPRHVRAESASISPTSPNRPFSSLSETSTVSTTSASSAVSAASSGTFGSLSRHTSPAERAERTPVAKQGYFDGPRRATSPITPTGIVAARAAALANVSPENTNGRSKIPIRIGPEFPALDEPR